MLDYQITDPVLFFAVLAAVALFVPLLFDRMRLPGIVGLILTAVLLGPHGLGLLERTDLIEYLGQAGLLFIVFVAGLEIDLARFSKYRSHSLVFGSISYLIPQILGAVLAMLLLGFTLPQAILLGSMFGSHTLLAYPVASRLGIVRSTPVATSVGGTIITDATAFLVLAIIANTVVGESGWGFWLRFSLLLGLFVVLVFRVLPPAARWFYRTIPDEGARDFLFTILMLFAFAWFAQFAGLQPIIGAFMCGIALNSLIPERSPLMSRVQFVGKTLLVPMFLISVGMLVDPRAVFGDRETLSVVVLMSGTVILTKWMAAFVAGKSLRYSNDECWILFGMSVNQAAATLAAVIVGYNIGLFSTAVVNGAVIMILVTCLIGPWVTERWGRKLAEATEFTPVRFGEAPQRILIPMANPATVEPLMDLALLLRDPASREPIIPLAVVTDDSEVESKVSKAEKLLAMAAIRGNAGEAPIYPVTRVDVNIADGIRRALAEQQITTVVIGWHGAVSLRHKIFGTVVDQVLSQTRQMVVVARIDESLNSAKRILLATPRSAEREPTFGESVHLIKALAQQLSAPVRVVGPSVGSKRFQHTMRSTRPEAVLEFEPMESLSKLPGMLGESTEPNDLLILLSARDHRLSWTHALETLPRQIAAAHPNLPFLVIYPSEDPSIPIAEKSRPAPAITPETDYGLASLSRLILKSPASKVEDLIAEMVAGESDLKAEDSNRLREGLIRSANEYPLALREGICIVHMHDAAVADPRLYIATLDQTLSLPVDGMQIQVLVALVSPVTATPERHLRVLRAVALHLRNDAVVETLSQARHPAEAWEALRGLNEEE